MRIRNAESKEAFIDQLVGTWRRADEAWRAYGNTDQDLPRLTHIVTYDLDRAFGGAEEGGWWYDVGTVEDSIRFNGERELRVWLGAIWDVYYESVMAHRPYTSAAGGFDIDVRLDHGPGKDFPEEAPRYE